MSIGFQSDAEAWGHVLREIIECRRPNVWKHLDKFEDQYVKWAATWAFHWARKV